MNSKAAVERKQDKWANIERIKRDELYSKYTKKIEDNLYKNRLSKEAELEFKNADGAELTDGKYPAKIKALHSSSALAYNVFEYWRNREKTILAEALSVKNEINVLQLEKVLSTGISNPNIDVFLTLNNGTSISIESKFCEWMDSKKDKIFKERYFFENNNQLTRWADAGLINCQEIADRIQAERLTFIRLDATQLLKHALGIANTFGKNSQLLYIYYDLENQSSRIANKHRDEIKEFTDLIGDELTFKTMSYQNLFREIKKSDSKIDIDYLNYLEARYF